MSLINKVKALFLVIKRKEPIKVAKNPLPISTRPAETIPVKTNVANTAIIPESPFLLTPETLKTILKAVKTTSRSLSRKFIIDFKKKIIAIDGSIKSEHLEIAQKTFGETLDSESISGGVISFKYENNRFVITLSGHSAHFDHNRPDFFQRLQHSRKAARNLIENYIKSFYPGPLFLTVTSSLREEIFSFTLDI